MSVDPLARQYPFYTPYQFAGNKPIQAIDLDGLEEFKVTGLDGTTKSTYGSYKDQSAAQSSSDQGEINSNTLPLVTVTASRMSSANSSISLGQTVRGGALASGYNGALRVNYATRSFLTSPLYSNGLIELKYMNMLGSVSRFSQKEFTRINAIGGRAHLDFVDPNSVKFGTRFYRSNTLVNAFGAAGVIYGGYHAFNTGKTFLSLDNAQDRFDFATAETARNLGAIHQMRIASSTYASLSTKLGLGSSRMLNLKKLKKTQALKI